MNASRITQVRLLAYALPLRRGWRSAAGGFTRREGWLIRMDDAAGRTGLGDCAPLPQAGTESRARAQARLESWRGRLTGMTAEAALAELDGLRDAPAARCGLEMALIDLLARGAGLSAARWLNPRARERFRVNAQAGALLRPRRSELARAAAVGKPAVVKLKVGLARVDAELACLRALVRDWPGLRLRLDANRAWDWPAARRFIDGCADLPVESIEEPLRNPLPDRLRALQARAGFVLALDESLAGLTTGTGWPALLAAPPVRRLVFKPLREGGLLRVLERVRQARARGLECVLTTTVDSAVGVQAAAHLAAALEDGSALCHGLATSDWLQRDLLRDGTRLPLIRGGQIHLPARAGFGIDPDQIMITGSGTQ